MSIKQKSLFLLSRREHSRRELFLKLSRRGFSDEDIVAVLDELQNENLLNEDRFIACFIRSRCRKGHGPLKICAELQNRGIDPSRIFANEEWQNVDWVEIASRVRMKRFGTRIPTSILEQAKVAQYLQRRGFTMEQIRKVSHDECK